jgi:tetratricopeptide (TPR) repeat protein
MRVAKPRFLLLTYFAAITTISIVGHAQEAPLDAAKNAFEKGEYAKVIAILEPAGAKDPNNGDLQLLLTKAYLQTNQTDAAIKSAERAVSINPNNSEYHDWLGQAYGDKASHASMFSAYPLARKTQKEFETAVNLDQGNFDAAQNLVEYDCTAPGVVGGGEDKAQPIIQKLAAMDAAEGHYAAGDCRMQKKDFDAVDAEFSKALESKPKSMDLIYEMAVYFTGRGQGDKVLAAADVGQAIAPTDPRVNFFRAVGWILESRYPSDAEKNLRGYLPLVLPRPDYPSASATHYWIGRLYQTQKNISGARSEYEAALKLNPKYKNAQEALQKLGNG